MKIKDGDMSGKKKKEKIPFTGFTRMSKKINKSTAKSKKRKPG